MTETAEPVRAPELRQFAVKVDGEPAPQGSKTAGLRALVPSPKSKVRCPRCKSPLAGRFTLREQVKAVKPWRKAVQAKARQIVAGYVKAGDWEGPITGPVQVVVSFTVPQVKLPRRVRYLGVLVPAVHWPHHRPDLDKLLRAVFDGLTDAGVWEDDGQVCMLTASKLYPDTPLSGVLPQPGVSVQITQLRTMDVPAALPARVPAPAPAVAGTPPEAATEAAPVLF